MKKLVIGNTRKTSDLTRNPFVQLLNRGCRDTEFGSMVFPASRLFRAVERRRDSEKKVREGAVSALTKRTGGKANLLKTVEQLKENCRIVHADLLDAFPIEQTSLSKQLNEQEAKLNEAEKVLRKLQREEQKLESANQPLSSLHLKKQVDQILKKFPGSQLLDLGALTTFKNKDGLSAVTIFSLLDPVMTIQLENRRESRFLAGGSSFIKESQHKILFRKLAAQVAAATGVACGCKLEEVKKSVKKAQAEKWYKGGTEMPSLEAERIELETSFKSGVRIPNEIRALIRSAEESEIFEGVFLLAEVEKWQLKYYRTTGFFSPFLSGEIINPPKSKDPLIVAPAMIGKKELWFVIGAFDVTPIEQLIRDEFTTNPAAD